ncbi:hypothetical protein E2P81_ATG02558 [Venturia nashicola]|uniref:Biogenesis of lysosome-related organelles complex 1 subunit 1 n=1 Tax=Venturia nashicola TaxID=86259 RepID=A0A4Z1P7J7_9PEZI|nr:hypothetical protein E6O75_ATG02620 [Venturia nashicola]TLD36776.1 hypothetical protein E2P81_ATG02558 [Venturia nashicola]
MSGHSTAGPSMAGPSTAGPSMAGPTTAGLSMAGPTTAGPSMSAPSNSTTSMSTPNMSPSQSAEDDARRTAEARTAVTATLSSVGSAYDIDLQRRAADLHANSKVIEKQERELINQTAGLAKQSAQWEKMISKSTKQLNEIGDVQNWAEVMERDLLRIEETLRLVEGRPDEGNISGTNGPRTR